MTERPDPLLVVFCKRPRPGYGKQRLAAEIGTESAYRIALALLDCALEDAATWSGGLVLAPSEQSDLHWARSLAARPAFKDRQVIVEAQADGNLGERLADMDSRLRISGGDQVIFMASDVPGLQREHFSAVVSGMIDNDVVLADDVDGGVTLMASRNPWPKLTDLPWSTPQLGDALSAACTCSGLSVKRMDGGFDIDTAKDVREMTNLLRRDTRPARRALVRLIAEEMLAVG